MHNKCSINVSIIDWLTQLTESGPTCPIPSHHNSVFLYECRTEEHFPPFMSRACPSSREKASHSSCALSITPAASVCQAYIPPWIILAVKHHSPTWPSLFFWSHANRTVSLATHTNIHMQKKNLFNLVTITSLDLSLGTKKNICPFFPLFCE